MAQDKKQSYSIPYYEESVAGLAMGCMGESAASSVSTRDCVHTLATIRWEPAIASN